MALNVQSPLSSTSSRAFLAFLAEKQAIKSGFQSVLSSKTLPEISSYLLDHHLLEGERLSELFAQFYRLPFVRLISRPIRPEVIHLIPEEVARKYKVIAYDLQATTLYLAIGRPEMLQHDAPHSLIKLRKQKGLTVHLAIVPEADVSAVISKAYQKTTSHPVKPSTQLEEAAVQSVVNAPTIASLPPLPEKTDDTVVERKSQLVEKKVESEPTTVTAVNKKDLIRQVEPREKHIDLTKLTIPLPTLTKIPYSVAKKYQLIVFEYGESKSQFEPALIKVAVINQDDPHVKEILSYIEQRNKVLIDKYLTDKDSVKKALTQYPEAEGDTEVEAPESKAPAESKIVHHEASLPKIAPLPESSIRKEMEGSSAKPLAEPTAPLPQTTSSPSVPSAPTAPLDANAIRLTAADITNRPTEESAEELQRLARQQELNIEDQNLDRLIKEPVLSVEQLTKYFKRGIIPEMVAATLFLAIRMKASDIHIEAMPKEVRLRFRVDGILHDIIRIPAFLQAPLISRIKILAKMKIDEQRVPQDGRFDVIIDNRQVDLRISTLPTVHGEKVVMRLLDKSGSIMSLEQMGLTGSNFDVLVTNIEKPYGIILATGPTGSGKSTTLYAILSRLSKPGVNIITLEDPVEYELPGVNQAQVKPQIGFTFAEGLRSVLRQDPNIIMVGEIRDLETASMATHAALTGHLVLSTLHTNDAAGALPRLINMGVEPFLITSSMNAVIGQRLVRRVCESCKEKEELPPALLQRVKTELSNIPSGQLQNLNMEELVFYHGRGCTECTDGYSGRIGIFEVLSMSGEIEDLAVKKAPASEIKAAAIKAGMITMVQDGLMKALKGITTVDEVLRVTTTQNLEIPGG